MIAHEKLKLLSWNTKSNLLLLQARSFGDTDRPAVVYQKNGTVWERVETRKLSASQRGPIDVVLAEDMNTPPKIFAVDPQTGQKALVLDLNPQFGELRLGKVEAVTWKATDGREVEGGLYYPPGYVRGQRYPLVIQSHGFTRERFWVDGPWSTAFAAQPLANRGFVVLQVGPAKNLDEESRFVLTPNEPIRWMSGVEGAIDYLDRIGLIDSARVGIIGFSRTCFYVQYALTHSVFHFAAALVADGIDGGYVQYIVYANANPELAAEFDAINSGPPFGDGLSSWLKLAPGFSLNTVKTPLRIEANSRSTLLGEWEWFSGLSRLHKPVELIYLPEGTHILEKPWERITSQQGSVDWFCFWLKGEEDPDPAKAERYARWRELRKQHEENMKKLCARSQEQLCLGPLAFRRSRCKLFSRPEEPTYIVR